MNRLRKQTEDTEDSAAGGIGCLVMFAIVIALLLKLAMLTHEGARIVNILLNFGQYMDGFGGGFKDAFTSTHSIFPKLVLPAIAISLTLLFLGGVTLFAALLLSSLRRRTPNVFLSYHHSMLSDVGPLAKTLRTHGFRPLYVPFETAPEHDALLDQIYSLIQRADFVLCLPGPSPSFVESEISAAIVRKLPVFFLLLQSHSGIPNTANHSYPVLRLDYLRKVAYAPLVKLIEYMHGRPTTTFRLYFTPTRPPKTTLAAHRVVGFSMAALIVITSFAAMFSRVYEILTLNASVEGYIIGYSLGCFALALASWLVLTKTGQIALGGIAAVRNRSQALKQIRRFLSNGEYSYCVLRPLFRQTKGLLLLLRPFFRDAQLAHHEIYPAMPCQTD